MMRSVTSENVPELAEMEMQKLSMISPTKLVWIYPPGYKMKVRWILRRMMPILGGFMKKSFFRPTSLILGVFSFSER